MCREDLGLGRGRYVGNAGTFVDGAAPAQLCRSNPKRVAMVLSGSAVAGGSIQIMLESATGKVALLLPNGPATPFTLDVEVHGQLVTSELWAGGTATGALYSFVEILSEVDQDPIMQ